MKTKRVLKTLTISERQNEMLQKLSNVSLLSEAALLREGLELLFKTPGGQYATKETK